MNDPLSQLSMWNDWQNKVIAALPYYAADMIYVAQNSTTVDEYSRVVNSLLNSGFLGHHFRNGQTRDVPYGARVLEHPAIGEYTRMWLDSQVEIDFLQRNYGDLSELRVFEIGAGYGRLAAELAGRTAQYSTVDPVPISTKLCAQYCAVYAQDVVVRDIPTYRKDKSSMVGNIDLAINIHSWNECTADQISGWLTELRDLKVDWLFTVSHGTLVGDKYPAYRLWNNPNASWKPLLLNEFDLIAEESVGVDLSPHALWRRK